MTRRTHHVPYHVVHQLLSSHVVQFLYRMTIWLVASGAPRNITASESSRYGTTGLLPYTPPSRCRYLIIYRHKVRASPPKPPDFGVVAISVLLRKSGWEDISCLPGPLRPRPDNDPELSPAIGQNKCAMPQWMTEDGSPRLLTSTLRLH